MNDSRKLLKGWKEIGRALYRIAGMSTDTLRRHAPPGLIRRLHGAVYCYQDELEDWWRERMQEAEKCEKNLAQSGTIKHEQAKSSTIKQSLDSAE